MTHAELARPSRKQRVRTLWISDVHLGTRDCQAEHLSQFLKGYQADRIYRSGTLSMAGSCAVASTGPRPIPMLSVGCSP